MIFPVVVGSGAKLWHQGTAAKFDIAESFITKSGVAVITYVPA